MVTITNQQLYSDFLELFKETELTENSAEGLFSITKEILASQEEFTDELKDKCAAIAFDAINDLYQAQQGIDAQQSYTEENSETLFNSESQEVYTGLLQRWKEKYEDWQDARAERKAKKQILNDIHQEKRDKERSERFKNAKKNLKDFAKSSRKAAGLSDKSSFGEKIDNAKAWLNKNKKGVAIAGGVAAAGATYLAYKAYKRKQAQKAAAQAPNANQQVQPNK